MATVKREKGRWGETIRIWVVDENGNTIFQQHITPARTPIGANNKDRRRQVDSIWNKAKQAAQSFNDKQTTTDTASQSNDRISFGDDNLYHTDDGRAFSTIEDAQDHLDTLDAKGEFDENITEFEDRIKAAGQKREALASRIGARKEGMLLSQLQRSILGTGGDQAQVEALTPRIQEGSQRSLLDYITKSEGQTLSDLANTKQFEVKGDFDLEGLGIKRDALTDAMQSFIMGQETDRAKIQATLDMQPEWWEQALGQFAGGLGQGLGNAAGSAVASDRRVKENISVVGKLNNGLPVYLFNYKNSPTQQIGVMAQDVELVNQDAVTEIEGIKHVFYGKAVQ